MFKRKQQGSGASTRADPKARAELQHQLEERLSYWRLFLEAKQLELEERRAAGEFAADVLKPVAAQQETSKPVAPQPVQRAGAARTNAAPKPKLVESDDQLI
jgi:hypothetical protein